MSFALGIDLGGSCVKAVAVTTEGKLLSETNVSFDVNEKMDWARRIERLVRDVESEQQSPAQAIGLSAPGLVALDGKSVATMPGRLNGLEGLNWAEFLKSPLPVPVLNDAHAALLGEAWLGAARGFRNVFMLTLGTGVGGAAMVDGRLLKGAVGRAGHMGHVSFDVNGSPDICGMPGSLEVMVGNCSIADRTGGRFQSTHELVEAHRRGDPQATDVWIKSMHVLGCAVASFINVLDPEAVIVGGGIARAGAALFEPLESFVRKVEWNVSKAPVKILPAQLGELAGAYGAAWNALNASAPPDSAQTVSR